MSKLLFRCSSIGKLMTEPKTLAEGPLSVGARTYIRQLVAQEIFGVTFDVSSKQMEKGIAVEDQSIAMLNRVRGLSLVKNVERKENDFITGEADLFDTATKEGRDLKSSWSLATFPIAVTDCKDKLYEWQMRGYMCLWGAQRWHVDYAMVNTPEDLIGSYEPLALHIVGHIPEHMRLTTWTVTRDMEKEAQILEKARHARAYYAQVLADFDRTHGGMASEPITVAAPACKAEPTTKAVELTLPTF